MPSIFMEYFYWNDHLTFRLEICKHNYLTRHSGFQQDICVKLIFGVTKSDLCIVKAKNSGYGEKS